MREFVLKSLPGRLCDLGRQVIAGWKMYVLHLVVGLFWDGMLTKVYDKLVNKDGMNMMGVYALSLGSSIGAILGTSLQF